LFGWHEADRSQRGIPTATVAINNGMNAGLLAVRILSAGSPSLVDAMEKYMHEMEEEVMGKVTKLEEIGWEKYEVKK
jgi:phosphoribosylaminoimidazole carboxylase